MPRFSERVGAVKVEIQLGSMDERLKNSIWNLIAGVLPGLLPGAMHNNELYDAVVRITAAVLKRPIDEVPRNYPSEPRDWLLQRYQRLTWADIYDLVEFAVAHTVELSHGRATPEHLKVAVNGVLQEEHSAYRVIGEQVTPITSPTEIAEVETALGLGSAKFEGVRTHIGQALAHFGQRPSPDYRNAIKEAISAVESAVKVISGESNATLDDALKIVAGTSQIHPAMVDAFRKLYGYTSDEKGIRHSLLEETANAAEEDARFMIVACSAFVNLLMVKTDRAGILK